jgi:hypothetical protein
MIEGLELEMQKIAVHEIDQAKVQQEYEQLLQWFERVEDRGVEEMPYTMKRNLLRIIGLKVYVFKTDKRHEDIQYNIEVTLPQIADLLSTTTDDIIPDATETWANDIQEACIDEPDNVRRADGTDAADGHIATRAFRA